MAISLNRAIAQEDATYGSPDRRRRFPRSVQPVGAGAQGVPQEVRRGRDGYIRPAAPVHPGACSRRLFPPPIAGPFPLILNLLKDVIPSVAEESKNPAVDSISGFSDSSATLGMTYMLQRINNLANCWQHLPAILPCNITLRSERNYGNHRRRRRLYRPVQPVGAAAQGVPQEIGAAPAVPFAHYRIASPAPPGCPYSETFFGVWTVSMYAIMGYNSAPFGCRAFILQRCSG